MKDYSTEAILREQLEAVQTQRKNDLGRLQRMNRTSDLLRFEVAQRDAEHRKRGDRESDVTANEWQLRPALMRHTDRKGAAQHGNLLQRILAAILLRFARAAAKRNDYAAAEILYQTIALLRPRTFLWWQIGNMLSGQGLFNSAVVCFERAIAENPDYIDAYLTLENALRQIGKNSEARKILVQASERGFNMAGHRFPK